MKLSELPNIGKELEKLLESIGMHDLDDLKKLGSIKVLRKISNSKDSACLNKLYAIEGAIRGIRWHKLSSEDKRRLKEEFLNYYND